MMSKTLRLLIAPALLALVVTTTPAFGRGLHARTPTAVVACLRHHGFKVTRDTHPLIRASHGNYAVLAPHSTVDIYGYFTSSALEAKTYEQTLRSLAEGFTGPLSNSMWNRIIVRSGSALFTSSEDRFPGNSRAVIVSCLK